MNLFRNAGLKIMVAHQTMCDQNQKLSDQSKNTSDILSDGKNSKQNLMPDQIMLLSDKTFNRRKLILSNKYITVLIVECTHFKHFPSIETA